MRLTAVHHSSYFVADFSQEEVFMLRWLLVFSLLLLVPGTGPGMPRNQV